MKGKFSAFILTVVVAVYFWKQFRTNCFAHLNPKVKTGKLANGLTYYILPNKKPEQKVELRLVGYAGAINEDDSQQGACPYEANTWHSMAPRILKR